MSEPVATSRSPREMPTNTHYEVKQRPTGRACKVATTFPAGFASHGTMLQSGKEMHSSGRRYTSDEMTDSKMAMPYPM